MKDSPLYTYPLIFIIGLCISCKPSYNNSPYPIEDKDIVPKALQQDEKPLEIISDFYINTLNLNPIRIQLSKTKKQSSFDKSSPYIKPFSTKHLHGTHPATGTIDLRSNIIIKFENPNALLDYVPNEQITPTYTRVSPSANETEINHQELTPQKLFERILPVLEYYKQSQKFDEYTINILENQKATSRRSRRSNQLSEFLANSETEWKNIWMIRKSLTYNDTPVHGKHLSIGISSTTGRIVNIVYTPIDILPSPQKQTINKKQARELALDAIDRSDIYDQVRPHNGNNTAYNVNRNIPLNSITAIITTPNASNYLSPEDEKSIEILSPLESRYCWKVPINYKFYVFNISDLKTPTSIRNDVEHVYIDQETGQVIR